MSKIAESRALFLGAGRAGAAAAGLAAAALLIASALAHATEDIPDVKGPWTGKTFTIVAGAAPNWPHSGGTFASPALGEKEIVIDVTHQDGRRFWGVETLSGAGEKSEEPLIGELYGPGNHKVMMAHTIGVTEGEIDGNVLSFCYVHADSRGASGSSLVSCTEVRRAR